MNRPRLPPAPLLLLAAALGAASCKRGEAPGSAALFTVGSLGETLGKFHWPRALAVDPASGRLYVADRSGRIQLFEADGKPVLEWRLPEYRQGQPVGLAVEKDGSLVVNDSHYHRILRYSPDGSRILASWGTEGKGPGEFTFGRDVVVDGEGFIYAGDYGGLNDRIEKFAPDGRFLLEWGGCGTEPGKFQRPQGMAVERRGGREAILVADCANHRVQRFDRDGKFLGAFGSLGRGPGEFRYPMGIAAAEDGPLYVAEWGNNRVQALDPEGRSLGFWGAPGREPGELATPWEIALGKDSVLYIADYGNHRVQAFTWSRRQTASSVP
jgi:DNA-binding beta-propeller fold protein YncE